jgi:hypothetical protein
MLQEPTRRDAKSQLILEKLLRAISSLASSSSIGGKGLEKPKKTFHCLLSNGSRGSRCQRVERGILDLMCLVGIRRVIKSHTFTIHVW